jgi:hypothetical protein
MVLPLGDRVGRRNREDCIDQPLRQRIGHVWCRHRHELYVLLGDLRSFRKAVEQHIGNCTGSQECELLPLQIVEGFDRRVRQHHNPLERMVRGTEGCEKRRDQRQAAGEHDDARRDPHFAGDDAACGHSLRDRGEILESCYLNGEPLILEKVDFPDVGRDRRRNG